MTVTEPRAAATDSETVLVTEAIDALLAANDPTTMDNVAFRGARYDAGLAWVHFPKGYGGLGVRPELNKLVETRLREAGAKPTDPSTFFMALAGPTIVTHGSHEAKQRFLRPMFTGEEKWCQLFSEPGAGSDFAGLATKAERDGDEWIVNGQKVWNTMAHIADFGMLVTRTDPEAPKHKGMTYFALDMHAPGVEVRPLRQITGEAEFNEVYMTDARVPDAHRIGDVGEGWRASLTTLMNERNAIGTGSGAGSGSVARQGAAANDAVEIWKQLDPSEQDGARKDRLMQLWCQAEVNRLTNRRAGEKPRPATPARDDDRQAGVLRTEQAAVRVLRRPDGSRRAHRLRLHVPPPRRPRHHRRYPRHPLLVHAGPSELDRRRHVGDPAQHHRRTGPRPSRRAPSRQVGPVERSPA